MCSARDPRERLSFASNLAIPNRRSNRKCVVEKSLVCAYTDMAAEEESDEMKTEDDYIPDCDEDLESVHEGMVDLVGSTATKRKRARQILKTPEKKVAAHQVKNPTTTLPQPQWQWMQPPWMHPGVMGQQLHQPPGAMGQTMQQPPGLMGQQGPWMMGQGMPWMMGQPLPSQWAPPPAPTEQVTQNLTKVRSESEARARRRAARKEVETNADLRRSGGQKPHTLRVKVGGGIDGGCEGKKVFDEALRSLVPRILDVSILKWKLHHPTSIEKLRSAIDNEFEYLEHNLSDHGFKNAVKRQMKTERSKMKGWFMSGKTQCPDFIEQDQWARLCEYWSRPETEQKAQMMANARKQVKNLSNLGRVGKAGKETQLREKKQRSPGITKITEDFQEYEQTGACTSKGVYERMSARISALESTQNGFKQQLSEVLHISQTNQQSLQQITLVLNNLSSMFSIMMEKIANPGSICEPKSPTTQNTNSHMPSLEPMLNSWVGSGGDNPRKKASKVNRSEDAIDVATLNEKGVMGGGRSPKGDSKVGASKVNGTEAKESPKGGVMEGGSSGGGGNASAAVGEPTPKQVGNEKGGGVFCAIGA